MQEQLISIVIPIYNEAPNVEPLHNRIISVIKDIPHKFELIYVDDGSDDDSGKRLRQLAHRDKRVRVIQFARNFGKEIAVTAGLHAARGDAAIMMDADLQHPPKLLPQFIEEWHKGADVVVGIKKYGKNEGWFKTFTSRGFYWLLGLVSHSQITPHASDFRLINRRVLDAFGDFTERNRITRGIIDWTGFTRRYVYFETAPRHAGKAVYSYRKLFGLAFNTLTAYSLIPLKFASFLGWFILILSSLLGVFVVIEKYILNDPLSLNITGTAVLAIMLLFLVGVILLCLGFVALYIARIHDEVVNRPLYIVKDEVEGGE